MPGPRRSLLGVILALVVSPFPFPAAAQARFGLAAEQVLEIRAAPGGPVLLALPAHSLYFHVLDAEGERVHIHSLPSVQPPYEGWAESSQMHIYATSREARRAYFEAHPLRDRAKRFAALLSGGYWDLRDQGVDVQTESGLWLRYGFDFSDWWVVRGRSYYAEIREIADIQSADEKNLVLLLFNAAENTSPEPLALEILSDTQLRIRQADGPAHRFGRAPSP